MDDLEFAPLAGEEELPATSRLIAHAFGGTPGGAADWLRSGGLEHLRVLRRRGTAEATLMRVPMGQYFGGRSVPMLGIAGVAVAPEARGRGLARRLMTEALREARAEGFAISCLYPSTQALYRQVGYEQAGHRFTLRLPLAAIDVRERAGAVRPLQDGDRAEVEALYRHFATAHDGWLDRGPYCWSRVFEQRGEPFHGFGVEGPHGLDGYLYLSQPRKPETGRHDVVLSDLAFRTPAAGRRLLGFLADFSTIGDDLVFFGGPHHSLLWLLGQQRLGAQFKNWWMLRLVDVPRALEARGYPGGVSAALTLEVTDEVLPEAQGRWRLEVEGGQARVEPSDTAEVRLGVRALAALWSGFMTPARLALLGAVEGEPAALERLAGIFPGGSPAMPDMF